MAPTTIIIVLGMACGDNGNKSCDIVIDQLGNKSKQLLIEEKVIEKEINIFKVRR